MSWERRPSWARQQDEVDEPSRQDRHYDMEPVEYDDRVRRPTPRPRPSARRSYTQQAQNAWPDSQPMEPQRQADVRANRTTRAAQTDTSASTRGGQRSQRPSLRGNAASFASKFPQVRLPKLQLPDVSLPSLTDWPRFVGNGAGRPRSTASSIAQSLGEGVTSLVRSAHPAMLLLVAAAAVLLVWGMLHFFAGIGGRASSSPATYHSSSIINQASAPHTLELGSIDPLTKAAEERKQAQFEARLGGNLEAQRAYVASMDLKGRDQQFKLGASFPNNFESNGEKILYLTFDDGPSGVTQEVLDILDRYDAKATFFVTNLMPEHAHLIGEAYRRGHTIGLHTSTHDYAYVYSSMDNYFEDLDAIAATVEKQIGYVPCFVRFPGGVSNTISANYTEGIMTELSQVVPYRGYQYYDWNCENGDARGSGMSTQEIIDIALGAEMETEGSNLIMLLHDANDKQTTVEALPTIIEHFMREGYLLEAITPSSMVYHQYTAN